MSLRKAESSIPFTIQTCDGGSHRRKDRVNGGMYITRGDISLTIARMQPQETVIVQKRNNTATLEKPA